MKSKILKKLLIPLRITIGVGLVLFLLWKLDIQLILANLAQLDVLFLVYALFIYILFIVFSTWRWHVLLNYKKFDIPFKKTLHFYFIAQFFNNLLPTQVGGDVMRVLYTMKDRRADALATVLVDRILGFIGLFIFLAIVVIFYFIFSQQAIEFLPVVIIGMLVMLLLASIFFSKQAYFKIAPWLGKIRFLNIGERIVRLHKAGTEFGHAWNEIIICIILSCAIQILLASAPFLVMRGMGHHELGLLPFFVYLPLVNVISMIPVSPGALGVRENAYVFLLAREGLPQETAFAVSLVSAFLVFFISLVGGILFIFTKREKINTNRN